MIIVCNQCGKEKYAFAYKKDYIYKLRDKKGKMHYFCNYVCLKKAQDENPDKWLKRR